MATVFHARLYSRFLESKLRRKKLHRTNRGSNFIGGGFSNTDNVRAPIQFRTESQPQHLKGLFFLNSRSILFHISDTGVIRPVKRKPAEFFQHGNQQPTYCPSPPCLVDQIQIQKPILIVATDQMPDHN